jgi:hypothetical protein
MQQQVNVVHSFVYFDKDNPICILAELRALKLTNMTKKVRLRWLLV